MGISRKPKPPILLGGKTMFSSSASAATGPFASKIGYIHFPDGIYAESGLPAELLHFCEAARSPSLFLWTPLSLAFV